jgi:hypothetical protein
LKILQPFGDRRVFAVVPFDFQKTGYLAHLNLKPLRLNPSDLFAVIPCHCEERSDEAIQFLALCPGWIASLRSQ